MSRWFRRRDRAEPADPTVVHVINSTMRVREFLDTLPEDVDMPETRAAIAEIVKCLSVDTEPQRAVE